MDDATDIADNSYEDDKAGAITLLMELRRKGIRDNAVLRAMETVSRPQFLPPFLQECAYEDIAQPVQAGYMMPAPSFIARILEKMQLHERAITLDVGTGSGYLAALLGKCTRRVITIECDEDIHKSAQARLRALGYHNITAICGNGLRGWPESSPYDRIIVSGVVNAVPSDFLEQLQDGGILVIPVGSKTRQKLLRIEKSGWNYQTTMLCDNQLFEPLYPL